MRVLLIAIALGTATSLFAQSYDPLPADFTPSPCAPENACQSSYERSSLPSAAFALFGLTLDAGWIEQHADTVIAAMGLACRRRATCLGTAGNTFWFCDDVLYAEVHPVCDKLFPKKADAHNWDQCSAFRDTYLTGIELLAGNIWRKAQQCAKVAGATPHTKPFEVWMEPASLRPGFTGTIKFFAIDPDTHLPVLAAITFENQTVYAPANPAGNAATYYPIPYTLKLVRVPNSEGHSDIVPPMVTFTTPAYPSTADGPPYPLVKFRLPAEIPTLAVEMKPGADKLHKGKNRVIISARDVDTGKPVEMRVVIGTDQIGNTNEPLVIDLEKSGHHPEIWLTSLYDRYSDVVVAKAR